jgi:O-antigen/teichoic acid export membrane protein
LGGVQQLLRAGFLDLLFSLIFVQGSSYLLQFAVGVMLGAEEFAPIKVAETWLALAILPAAVGMPTAVVRFTADRRYPDQSVLSQGLATVLVVSQVAAAAVFLLVGMLASSQVALLVRILAWSLAFSAITRTVLSYFQGLREIKRAARINTVTSLASLAITVGLTGVFGTRGWLVGRFLSEVLFAGLMLLLVRHRIRFTQWDSLLWRRMLRMGIFAMLSLLVGRAALQGDMLLVDALVDNQLQVGNYGMATLARFAMGLPVGALAAIMLPYLVERLVDLSQAVRFFLQTVGYALIILVPMCALILAFPTRLFIAILGQDYALVLGYVRGLLPAIVCGALLTLTNNFLVALEKTNLSFFTFLGGLAINLLLGFVLIRRMGVPGAIIASDVTAVLQLGGQASILVVLIRNLRHMQVRSRQIEAG